MDYFGDESGQFKGLLNDNCEVCVIAIVAGARIDCQRCPKRTVRRIDDIPEAKWHDLQDYQKRRLFDCLSEQDELQFGYATFEKKHLHSLQNYHLLYSDVDFPPAWDLALAGYAYGEILFEMGGREDSRAVFTFDRISSKKQSKAVADHISHFVRELNVFNTGSRQSSGVQAADCLAGGIAEDIKYDTDWLDYLDPGSVTDCRSASLIQLENDPSNY